MSARALRVVPDQPDDDAPDFDMPRDDDAERATLGAVMLGHPEILEEIRDLVEPEDFYRPAHETIFRTLCELADTGRPRDALARWPTPLALSLPEVGGPVYFHSLMEAVPTAANGPYYAQLVRDKAYSRRMVVVGTRLAQMGRTELEPDLIAAAEREVMTLFKREVRGWPEPVALTRIRAVPRFPVAALTTWTRAKVEAVAHETQTPVDLAATLALACLSATAAGGKVRVMVRPEVRWSEPVNLYSVSALPPGSRKSPVFSSMTAPISRVESALAEKLLPEIITLRVDKKAAEDQASRAADQLAKASIEQAETARYEAHAAALAAAAITVPAEPQLFVDDITPESLASMIADQGGAIAGLSAESEIFNVIAGRYSGTPNLNVFLKGHAGDAMRVSRQSRAPETIERPALTLGICTQPGALAEFAAIPGANDRGLLARFLFTIPESNIGDRETEPEPADATAHLAWDANLAALILSMRDLTEPITLTLSSKADALRQAVSADYEVMMAEGGQLAGMRDWASKAVGTMARIAGLLHLAEHLTDGFERPISFETMAGAQALIDYYTDHALAVFDLMATDPATARARALWDWIERSGTVRFTARDAFSSLTRTKFPKMADLEPALAVLEQHGYLRRLPGPPSTGRGRPPAPTYETNTSRPRLRPLCRTSAKSRRNLFLRILPECAAAPSPHRFRTPHN